MTEKSEGGGKIKYVIIGNTKYSSGGDYYFYETDFNCYL